MQAHLVDPTSDFFRFGAAVAIALCAAAAWRSVIWGTDFATRHARHFRGPFGHLRFAWRRGAHVWASFISAILILRILFPGQPLIEEMAHPMLLTMFGAIAFAFVGSFHYPARDVGGI
ncbi:hypothetical protein [Jannaschia aquimarina]|nr:hypothetical protein [Jannaschia aquimarina]